jgi:UDP-N-acetyl-D-glucosamine dehydrogenase
VSTAHHHTLSIAIDRRTAVVGVIGLGYVGLPLAVAVASAGFATIGFDIDAAKPEMVNGATSYIDGVDDGDLQPLVRDGRLRATGAFDELSKCDVIIICVPTPLTSHREPDLSYVVNTAEVIALHLKGGELIILESTVYPGACREILKPQLESSGLRAGLDFFIGYSPERESPGRKGFPLASIPKIVAGDGSEASVLMRSFYSAVVEKVVPVSRPDVAEAVKITENVFRAVNIALANELKVIFDSMNIDVWEVIDAARTKPFGFMPFYPGPGLGGHCIPIDPFYLTWKAREFEVPTRFIELAGEINIAMPSYVVGKLEQALGEHLGLPLRGARLLLIGASYKKNVADIRESPAFKLTELLEKRGASVNYHDPLVSMIPLTRDHSALAGRFSIDLTRKTIGDHHAILICTDHDAVDFKLLADTAPLIVDTRNAMEYRGLSGAHIVKA